MEPVLEGYFAALLSAGRTISSVRCGRLSRGALAFVASKALFTSDAKFATAMNLASAVIAML